jgi:gas vesicle protein
MMRSFGKLVLALGAVALLASPAWAQGRGGFGGGGAAFLAAPNVQKDLKLTDDQVKKVQETLTEIREKHQPDFAALKDASPDVRQATMAKLNETVSGEVKRALSLTPEQSKRFDQISLQARGLQAFASPTVAEKLKLTNDQTSKVREILEAMRGSGGGGAFNKDASAEEKAAARTKRAAAQKENMTKVQALLTDGQKNAWKELTSEPIEIQCPARRSNN